MKYSKGSISIFMIIIVMASVAFGGVFIDYSRVLVAKNRVRTANESAVRSCLAGYDEDLVSEWGLFGLLEKEQNNNQNNTNKEFKKYVNANLITSGTSNNGKILNFDNVECNIELSKSLGEREVFEGKIAEFEKYRGPVSMTMGVIEKFKAAFTNSDNTPLKFDTGKLKDNVIKDVKKLGKQCVKYTADLAHKKSVYDNVGQINAGKYVLINERGYSDFKSEYISKIDEANQKLDNYKNSLAQYKEANDSLPSSNDKTTDPEASDAETQNKINEAKAMTEKSKGVYDNVISQIDNSKNHLQKFKDMFNNNQNELDNRKNDYNNAVNEYNDIFDEIVSHYNDETIASNTLIGIISNRNTYTDAKIDEIKQQYDKAENLTNAAKDVNTDIKNYNKNVENKDYDQLLGYLDSISKNMDYVRKTDIFGQIFVPETTVDMGLEKIEKLEETEENQADNEKIDNINKKIDDINDKGGKYKNIYNRLATLINGDGAEGIIASYGDEIKELFVYKEEVENKAQYYKQLFGSSADSTVHLDIVKDSEMDKIDNYMDKIKEIAKTNGDDNSDESVNLDFSKLTALANKDDENNPIKQYIDDIKADLTASMPSSDSVQQASDTIEDKGIIKMLKNISNYFSEMVNIVTKPEKLRNKMYFVDYVMNNCTYLTQQPTRNHHFKKGEVEYIIYGKESQLENILLSVGEVAIIRFVINAVNYWITTPGELVTRTVSALTRGLYQTVNDMTTMLIGGNAGENQNLIAVCPSLSKFKVLSYSDHLRLLLLLKMNDDGGSGALKRCIYYTLDKENKFSTSHTTVSNTTTALASNKYLGDYYTQAKGKVTAYVDLYFIRMFLPEFASFGNIQNGKYKVESTVVYGY